MNLKKQIKGKEHLTNVAKKKSLLSSQIWNTGSQPFLNHFWTIFVFYEHTPRKTQCWEMTLTAPLLTNNENNKSTLTSKSRAHYQLALLSVDEHWLKKWVNQATKAHCITKWQHKPLKPRFSGQTIFLDGWKRPTSQQQNKMGRVTNCYLGSPTFISQID